MVLQNLAMARFSSGVACLRRHSACWHAGCMASDLVHHGQSFDDQPLGFGTLAIHLGNAVGAETGAIHRPITLANTYALCPTTPRPWRLRRIRGVRPHRAHDFGLFRPAAAVSESQDGSVTTMAGLLRRHRDNTWRPADDDGTYRRQTASFWTVADTKRRFAVGNGPKTGPITTPTRLSIGTSPFRGPLPTLASCHGTQRR